MWEGSLTPTAVCLLPESFFGAVHERFRTPWKSTILTGCVVALGAALVPLRILAELVNIGTLLAFVMVCLAVLIMRRTHRTFPLCANLTLPLCCYTGDCPILTTPRPCCTILRASFGLVMARRRRFERQLGTSRATGCGGHPRRQPG